MDHPLSLYIDLSLLQFEEFGFIILLLLLIKSLVGYLKWKLELEIFFWVHNWRPHPPTTGIGRGWVGRRWYRIYIYAKDFLIYNSRSHRKTKRYSKFNIIEIFLCIFYNSQILPLLLTLPNYFLPSRNTKSPKKSQLLGL